MILLFFSRGLDVNESIKELNFELEKISKWAFKQKMQFNPDPNKQANQVIFSRKSKVYSDPPLTLNNNVKKYPHQKHLGIILDSKLDLNIHVDNKIKKCFTYHLQILYQTTSGLWRYHI